MNGIESDINDSDSDSDIVIESMSDSGGDIDFDKAGDRE